MLTIGDFSRLSRVTPRMLRHYDALGLLRPETIGENGYRYYRQEQLSVLARIQWLKGYGFSLNEIGELLVLDGGQLVQRLRQRRLELYQELSRQQGLIHRIEADILCMEGIIMIETPYHVVLIQDPEQKVFSIRETAGIGQYHALYQRLFREAAARGLKQAGPIQSRCATMMRHSTRSVPMWRFRWWWTRMGRMSKSSLPAPAQRYSTRGPMSSCNTPMTRCALGWGNMPGIESAVRP